MDLLMYNGIIHTMDSQNTVVAAIEIKDGKIAFIGTDEEAGRMECGKLAGMTVLSQDIFAADVHRIKDIQIEETLVGGLSVYKRGCGARGAEGSLEYAEYSKKKLSKNIWTSGQSLSRAAVRGI